MKGLMLHEMTHILIFHPTLLRRLNMITTKNSVSYVSSKNVVAKAREHFNCKSITGIALENQGGSFSVGPHWEVRYILGDYMISHDYIDIVLSDNKGCDFINENCIVDSEIYLKMSFVFLLGNLCALPQGQ